jgi:uncharacterized protein (DUF1697 family)
MTVYISLLRGINVSGQKIIKMAELRSRYQSLSFKNVQSYIQSGNVIFTIDNNDTTEQLAKKINQAILAHYQFDVPVFILTPEALQNARSKLPFAHVDVAVDGSKVLLCFLSDEVSNPMASLSPYLKDNEHLSIIGKVLYLHCEDGLGRSKLTIALIEKKLKVSATARNLKTVDKLLNLAESTSE